MIATKCQRCGIPAIRREGSKKARLLRGANEGVCLECGVVDFIQMVTNMSSSGTFTGLPEGLRLPHVQEQFARLMDVGKSDARPEDIDWERVIAVWDVASHATETLW